MYVIMKSVVKDWQSKPHLMGPDFIPYFIYGSKMQRLTKTQYLWLLESNACVPYDLSVPFIHTGEKNMVD